MLSRAYSLLTVKDVNEEQRVITGIASTPTPDRMGDVVEPMGAKFKTPMPLLLYHKNDQPVGVVEFAKPTKAGIPFRATLPIIPEAGTLRDRVDEAWQSVKYRMIGAVSIGFQALEDGIELLKSGGLRFTQWEWLELSLVTVPAQAEAVIQSFKSMDAAQIRAAFGEGESDNTGRAEIINSLRTKQLAASGNTAARVVRLEPLPPGVSGKKQSDPAMSRFFFASEKVHAMNVQDHIKQLESTRAGKIEALNGITQKSAEAGTTMDAQQTEEFDTLAAEIDAIDADLTRCRKSETLLSKGAVRVPNAAVEGDDGAAQAAADRARHGKSNDGVVAVEKKLDKGIAFARFVKTMATCNGNAREALDLAKERYPEERPLHNIIKMHIGQGQSRQFIQKTAVDAAITSTDAWAGALVQYNNMAQDFIEFLRPQTILGRIPGLRMVPFKVRVPRQTGGGTASWVGEGKAKPLTSLAFDTVTLDFTKIATIAVLTDEVVRLSTPSAEAIVRDQLAAAIIQQMDSDFIDPSNAGTANVKPASITNGVTATASSGNAEANVRADILSVFQPWITNNVTPSNAVWIMSATTALGLSLMVNSLGQPSFPGISMNGGTFQGLPVIVSESAGVVNGSAGGHVVVLLNARDIMVADDGTVAVDASREASLEMSDAPSSSAATGTGASLVSMFQTNSLAIRAERWVNWVKARSTAVQYLASVNWGE